MIRKRSFFLFLLLFTLLVLQFALFAPDELEVRNPTEFLQVEDWDQSVQQSMENILLVESKDSKKVWDMKAVSAQALREDNAWAMVDVEAMFYAQSGTEFKVLAGLTQYDSATKTMSFSNKVKVTSSNNYFFETESLSYDPEAETLVGSEHVKFYGFQNRKGKYSELSAGEVLVDLKTSKAQLLGKVKSLGMEAGKQNIELNTENLIFSEDGNKAVFASPVVFQYSDLQLYGEEGFVQYDPKTKALSTMNLEKQVKVESNSRKAVAGRLLLEFAKERIILEDAPRLIQNEDELIGEKIIFRQAGKTLKIEGAKALLNSSGEGQVLDE